MSIDLDRFPWGPIKKNKNAEKYVSHTFNTVLLKKNSDHKNPYNVCMYMEKNMERYI